MIRISTGEILMVDQDFLAERWMRITMLETDKRFVQ
jgi:hypothetical protein